MEFSATMDKLSKATTAFVFMLLLLIIGIMALAQPIQEKELYLLALPIITLFIAFLYRPWKYIIEGGSIIILKQAGKTKIAFHEIDQAELLDDTVLKGAIRLFASGGLFGYYGNYWKRKFGHFHLYGTQRRNFVLLRMKNGKKIILTPDDPSMAEEIRKRI